jgi:hypothetical protein
MFGNLRQRLDTLSYPKLFDFLEGIRIRGSLRPYHSITQLTRDSTWCIVKSMAGHSCRCFTVLVVISYHGEYEPSCPSPVEFIINSANQVFHQRATADKPV